jgi:hypothetical protein
LPMSHAMRLSHEEIILEEGCFGASHGAIESHLQNDEYKPRTSLNGPKTVFRFDDNPIFLS